MSKKLIDDYYEMPVIALRGLILYPNMTLSFEVGRKKSTLALREAMNRGQTIFLTAQKSMIDDDPNEDELYNIGTIARVRQIIKVSNDTLRIIVEGISRGSIDFMVENEPFFLANINKLDEIKLPDELVEEAYVRQIQDVFDEYACLTDKMSPDVLLHVLSENDPGLLCDYIASNVMLRYKNKQQLLEQLDVGKRVEMLLKILADENSILGYEHDIQQKLQESIERNQREYYLREQIKVISQELGDTDNPIDEANNYCDKIYKLKLEKETEEKLIKEADKLAKMPSGAHEAVVVRNYLDTVLELPWNKTTKEQTNIKRAEKILESDHYGMKEVKERILELIAVRKLAPNVNGQIICLVGPPGVGKTSVAKSIAKATGRKYARISLGGVRDESDIRGHRKTYIGAMPGRIIDAVKKAGSKNCLILLDEVDKLGNDYKGDPSSALLEVLDGEQNNSFRDHYIEVPFDLSNVLFITTANYAANIPEPLYDRMEIIEMSSYTHDEKFHIAREHLIPKQVKKHGLTLRTLRIGDEQLNTIIECYTKEAGVRTLERVIAKICRKAARKIAADECKSVTLTDSLIEDMLGPKKYKQDKLAGKDEVGLVNGLAWTSVGGELLPIEVAILEGSGKLELTGSLGDVMKESARTAVSYIRANSVRFGIDTDFYKTKDIHIHAPEGAVPKDGPSAGVTMTTAIVSALTGIPVRGDVAMTGEVTLRGRVLPIGGLKEKTMAAYRNGVITVIIPSDNEADLVNTAEVVRQNIKFITACDVDTVLENALVGGIPDNTIKARSKKSNESADINIISQDLPVKNDRHTGLII